MKKKKQGYRKSFRTKKKRSILKSRLFWIIFLAVLTFAGLFYLFILSPIFQIKEIKVSGDYKTSSKEIIKIVEEGIGINILFFSSKSIFFDGFSEIQNKIKDFSPLIANVKISRHFPASLEIFVEERSPVATWRFEEESFFLDKEGVVFEKSETVKGPVIRGGHRFDLGEVAIDSVLLKNITDINLKLEREGIEVRDFLVSYPKITVKAQRGWEAYFDAERNTATQSSNLILVLKEEIPQDERENLEYIDLRFQERIFYKFRDI